MNSFGHFIAPPTRSHFVSHFEYSGANRLFSPPECDAIIALAEKRGFAPAAIGNPENTRVDSSYRCASLSLIEYASDSDWLYGRITQRVQWANEHFNFELTGLLEALQIVRYDEPKTVEQDAGHYDWHQDFGGEYMARRKISVVAQLSAPEDYDGCQLTIMNPGPSALKGTYLERGSGVIFPSWMPHCVMPITRGVRYALVAWVHGTPFR